MYQNRWNTGSRRRYKSDYWGENRDRDFDGGQMDFGSRGYYGEGSQTGRFSNTPTHHTSHRASEQSSPGGTAGFTSEGLQGSEYTGSTGYQAGSNLGARDYERDENQWRAQRGGGIPEEQYRKDWGKSYEREGDQDRGFFERMGDRVREGWNELTDRDRNRAIERERYETRRSGRGQYDGGRQGMSRGGYQHGYESYTGRPESSWEGTTSSTQYGQSQYGQQGQYNQPRQYGEYGQYGQQEQYNQPRRSREWEERNWEDTPSYTGRGAQTRGYSQSDFDRDEYENRRRSERENRNW